MDAKALKKKAQELKFQVTDQLYTEPAESFDYTIEKLQETIAETQSILKLVQNEKNRRTQSFADSLEFKDLCNEYSALKDGFDINIKIKHDYDIKIKWLDDICGLNEKDLDVDTLSGFPPEAHVENYDELLIIKNNYIKRTKEFIKNFKKLGLTREQFIGFIKESK